MTDRMPPIPRDQWTASQREAGDQFLKMRGQDVFGPFAVMLRSPEVMLRAAAMGDYMRYRTSLPPALNELIIVWRARHWSQQFEWYVHQPMALKAGLPPAIVAAVATDRRPDAMSSDESIVYEFSNARLRLQNVSDTTYARAVERFGERGVIDMIGVAGYYSLLSMMMNVGRTAVPADS